MGVNLSVVLATIAEIFGDFGYKAFARQGSIPGFVQGSAGYIGVIYFLIKSLRGGSIMYVNGMWDAVSGILESLAAYVILGERLNHPMQYLALVIISAGLLMLRHYGVSK